jgi:hypothetical protein
MYLSLNEQVILGLEDIFPEAEETGRMVSVQFEKTWMYYRVSGVVKLRWRFRIPGSIIPGRR